MQNIFIKLTSYSRGTSGIYMQTSSSSWMNKKSVRASSGACHLKMPFEVVETELGFMYDVLYTKAAVAYSVLGLLLRSTSFFSIIFTLTSFCFFVDEHEFSNIDISITYTLLFGAVVLEIYVLIMLILSHWTIFQLSSKRNPRLIPFVEPSPVTKGGLDASHRTT